MLKKLKLPGILKKPKHPGILETIKLQRHLKKIKLPEILKKNQTSGNSESSEAVGSSGKDENAANSVNSTENVARDEPNPNPGNIANATEDEVRSGIINNFARLVADIFLAMADPSFWQRDNTRRGLPRTLVFIRSTPDGQGIPHTIRIEISNPGFYSSFYTFVSRGDITATVSSDTLGQDDVTFARALDSANRAVAVANWTMNNAIRHANAQLGSTFSYAQASRHIENNRLRIVQFFTDRFFYDDVDSNDLGVLGPQQGVDGM